IIMLADRVSDARPDQEMIGGLDIKVRRNAFGRQVDSFETEIGIIGVGHDPVHAVFIRAPWVESAGPEVEVLGTIESGDDAGTIVAVRQGQLLATSFHPELTGDHRIHTMFVEIVRRSR
ncbi:MAG: pyridoxal 5'-phosphate synthase glutaminase subunit PdxT, partial [Actinobacteria bacterium]|nr:pyridoxal 5'-phosphate synthase glutaminase subunit PdxT [Actinomycetota bacterium]